MISNTIEVNLIVKEDDSYLECKVSINDGLSNYYREKIFPTHEKLLQTFHNMSTVYPILEKMIESSEVIKFRHRAHEITKMLSKLLWESVIDSFGSAHIVISVRDALDQMAIPHPGLSSESQITINVETTIGRRELYSGSLGTLSSFTTHFYKST